VNIVSIGLLLWQAAILRSTAWFMEASCVSLRSESRGLPKRRDGMGDVDNYEPNRVGAFAQDPSAVAPLLEVGDPSMSAIIVATTTTSATGARCSERSTQSSSDASTTISRRQWRACPSSASSRRSSNRGARCRRRARRTARR
jgi:hypothetical protein